MGSCLSSGTWDNPRYASVASTSKDDKSRVWWRNSNSGRTKVIIRRNSDSKMGQTFLRGIPGRMSLNGLTNSASLFTKQGKKGINQDSMIVWERFGSKEDAIFCGVFDGHGPYGHMVAKKVRDCLPLKLSYQWELDGNANIGSETSEGSVKGFSVTLRDSFLKAFKVMDKELKLHPYIDCYSSGTTAVTLVKQGHDLVIGNVGDSRAVLGTRDKDDSLIAVQLTEDQKPNLPREAERIRLCKGRVFALQNEPEVARVWMPHSNSPGLAMARAFGDFCLKDCGLISVPDISYRRLTEKDEFVVLATDGVWDVLSNEEVVDLVASAPRPSAAQAIVESAIQAWRFKYPSSKVDDCAAVCLYLDFTTTSNCSDLKPRGQAVASSHD